ncbi:MAG: glycosyltransferase family 4 protein [Candidatus Bathyarchaeia archaeon]
MNICMVSWEFPPRIVGGIASHCFGLSRSLAAQGCEVHVVTLDFPGAPMEEQVDGVKVHRVQVEIGHPNFLVWTLLFNHFMEKRVADLNAVFRFEVVHCHDWLTVPVGVASKHFLGRPLVATFHSTERGRTQGLSDPDGYAISGIEWWGLYEAKRLITVSHSMADQVCSEYKVPREKVRVIPNGVNPAEYEVSVDRARVRGRYGLSVHDKLVLFVGRLVPAKGVEYLIDAVPAISKRYPNVRFILVGDGWQRKQLEDRAHSTGEGWRVIFAGFLPEGELKELMHAADVLTVPSVYEPFGIVAIEGMACGLPVVASSVDGLSEVVQHMKTGVHVYPRSPESIAWGVDQVFSNESLAKDIAYNAKQSVLARYNWDSVAKETLSVYREATG